LSHGSLQSLPAVHELLASLEKLCGGLPHALARRACRTVIDIERKRILEGAQPRTAEALAEAAAAEAAAMTATSLSEVINATGIILHTAFGRACLPEASIGALASAARGYCSLQWDWESGARGDRDAHVEDLIRELTGAEAATVVNNNAAATMIILAAVAQGREVVVSRGQLVEIGGSFRIPDVMRQSGAVMREVGCTNRTHLKDYRSAIGPSTAALLRVHPSNYRIRGFTSEVPLEDLVSLGREHGIPVVDDLGAGSLVDLSLFGLPHEPTVPESIAAGAALVCSSGDKLIGGPQAGIIAGRRDLVTLVRKHPLARAMRVCKLTLAALEGALKVFLEDAEYIRRNHPVYAMISEPAESIRARAAAMAAVLGLPGACSSEVVPMDSYMGSGALPDSGIPSWGVAIKSPDPEALARALRSGVPTVAGRMDSGLFLLDLRTVLPGQAEILAARVGAAASALWA
jgi:L-seryl-tRNA(Ser) seleniumtransferase